jgi:hypothetical protein
MSVLSNSQVKLTSASGIAVYADSNPPPTADLNGRDGWLFTKSSGTQKFNYYLWSQGSYPLRLQDLRSVFMCGSVDTYSNSSSVPFIVIYTKPTGSGDAQPWYHSRISYSIDEPSNIIMLGEKVQFFSHMVRPADNYGYRQIALATQIKDGDCLPNEEILYITLQSDSAAADFTQILISDFGFETTHQEKITIKMKLDGN